MIDLIGDQFSDPFSIQMVQSNALLVLTLAAITTG